MLIKYCNTKQMFNILKQRSDLSVYLEFITQFKHKKYQISSRQLQKRADFIVFFNCLFYFILILLLLEDFWGFWTIFNLHHVEMLSRADIKLYF